MKHALYCLEYQFWCSLIDFIGIDYQGKKEVGFFGFFSAFDMFCRKSENLFGRFYRSFYGFAEKFFLVRPRVEVFFFRILCFCYGMKKDLSIAKQFKEQHGTIDSDVFLTADIFKKN